MATVARGAVRSTKWVCVGLVVSLCFGEASKRHVIDPDHLTIGFLVEHVGYAKVLGMFREARGEFFFDEDTATIRDVRIVVRTESVYTNQEDRDRHLRSPDFLNVEAFPEMIFESEGAVLSDRKQRLVGQLTLIGQTRPFDLEVTWNKTASSPVAEGPDGRKPRITGMSARGTLTRSDFGMHYGVADALVGDDVEILIEFESRPKQ